MPDFSQPNKFNKDAAVSSVKFGGDTFVLEVELNEMQEVWREKLRSIFRNYFGDGIFNNGTMTYDSDNMIFVIDDEDACVDGEVIHISNLSISAQEGDNIYLEVWDKEVTFQDTLKKYGNESEIGVTNHLLDERVLEETSRRIVLSYTITKTNGVSGRRYIHLATIIDNDIEVVATGLGGMVQRSGDSMQGILVAKSNNQYTTKQVRNVILSPIPPTDSDGENGDIWFQYE